MWIFCKIVYEMLEIDVMDFFISKLLMIKINDEFFDVMCR